MASAEIDERIAALYGPEAPADMRAFHGLLHVAAVWAGAPHWPAILIRPDSPRSATDRFALELARARADAILVTGKIVREEAELRYDRPGTGTPYAEALAQWRRDALGKREAPRLVVLSSGRDLDLDHGVFHGWARPLLVLSDAYAPGVRERLAARSDARIELESFAQPSLAATLELLRARGCGTISLEAGPRTVGPLYGGEAAARIDELMLSLFHGVLPEHLRGDSFMTEARVRARFDQVAACERREGSGAWSFTRWRASAAAE